MNHNNFHSVRSLISLKRHEQPDDAYFDELLAEFHRRQKHNHLNPSLHRELIERASEWFANTSRWNYVMGAGAAYALVFFSVIFFWPNNDAAIKTETLSYEKEQPAATEAGPGEDEADRSKKDFSPSP